MDEARRSNERLRGEDMDAGRRGGHVWQRRHVGDDSVASRGARMWVL